MSAGPPAMAMFLEAQVLRSRLNVRRFHFRQNPRYIQATDGFQRLSEYRTFLGNKTAASKGVRGVDYPAYPKRRIGGLSASPPPATFRPKQFNFSRQFPGAGHPDPPLNAVEEELQASLETMPFNDGPLLFGLPGRAGRR